MSTITCDAEASGLLDSSTIDYTRIPYKLKDNFALHCLVVEVHETGEIIAFYNGPKYEFDGRKYLEKGRYDTYVLEDYRPVEHTHYPLDHFPEYIRKHKVKRVIMHNGINYDLLVCKLWYGMDYSVVPDFWDGREVTIEDTLVTSKTLNPDRFGGHSLDNLAKKIGLRKIEFRKHLPTGIRFQEFAADMLYYCIRDVKINTAVFNMLEAEREGWNWAESILLEKAVAEIVTRQEHRGFQFNKALAEKNVEELDRLMEERRARVEPVLPPRPATKKFLAEHTPPANQVKVTTITPPKVQFKGDGEPSAALLKFAEKINAKIVQKEEEWFLDYNKKLHPLPYTEDVETGRLLSAHMQGFVERHGAEVNKNITKIRIFDKVYRLPLEREPLKTEMVATIEDTPHIKNWLVGLGWTPSQFAEKDLTVNAKKEKYKDEKLVEAIDRYVTQTLESNFCEDRCEHLKANAKSLKTKLIHRTKDGRGVKVYTNPSFTVGQDKEMCPALERIANKFPYAKDIVEYMTYRHRRNSILGGNLGWDEEQEATKGFMAHVRDDGRISTPADSCGAACVTRDTLVVTDRGCIPIIEIGKDDLVLTHNGVYGKVIDRISNGVKPVAEVRFSNGTSVKSTYNHPYLTPDGWKRLDQLTEGDEVYSYGEKELWKILDRYPNYYISSWGRILSKKGSELKLISRKSLWDRASVDVVGTNGKKRREGLGCLVLEAFQGPRPKRKECCHRDGNPTNNNIKNLYWGTSKENSADAKLHGRTLKASRSKSKLSQEDINAIREKFLHEGHKRGDDAKVAAIYGVSREHIRDIRLNKRRREGNTVNLYTEKFDLVKVVKIESKGEEPTFDITIEDHHSYLSNSVVTHNTSRFTHRVVANIPRNTSLFGENMRGMFGVSKGFVQLGFDFDGLESRMEAHYCWEFEGEERKYCNSLTKAKPEDVHCFDEETEILTPEGWKYFSEITTENLVAQWEEDGAISFVNPLDVVWQDYKGEMFELKGKTHLNQKITKNHRIIHRDPRCDNWKVTRAEDFTLSRQIIPTGGLKLQGVSMDENYLRLLIAVQADGYYVKDSSAIGFGFTKVAKLGRLKDVLEKLNLKYSVYENSRKGRVEFGVRIWAGSLTESIREYLGASKKLPWSLLGLDQSSLETVLNETQFWDGTKVTDTRWVIVNKHKENLEVLQAIAHCCNCKAYLNDIKVNNSFTHNQDVTMFSLHVNADPQRTTIHRDQFKLVPYEGKIGCVVVPSGFVVVRRGDLVFVSGNTKTAENIAEKIGYEFSRSNAKSVKYAATYGAQAKKIAKTIGCAPEVSEDIFNAFWQAAAPLAKLQSKVASEWQQRAAKKFIVGIDGRQIPTRAKHSILNSLFQSAGVLCAKRAMVMHDRALKKEGLIVDFFKESNKDKDYCQQMIAYHDECQLEVPAKSVKFKLFKTEEEAKQWKVEREKQTGELWSDIGHSSKGYYVGYCRAGELAVQAVNESGRYYNLNVELTAGYMLGNSWANCH